MTSRKTRRRRHPQERPQDGSQSTHFIWPSVDSRDFAEQIRRLHDDLKISEESASILLASENEPQEKRFAALYYLLFRLERNSEFNQYEQLCHKYRKEFGGYPYFNTFLATIARSKGGIASLQTALSYSETALQSLSDRPGVLHQYASIAADLLDLLEEPAQDTLVAAQLRVDQAIGASARQNGNFHATKARLLAHGGQFQEAVSQIQLALELENTSAPDSLRRIARFESIRSRIETMRNEARFYSKMTDAQRKLDSMRSEQLQLLGLLAAVVALVTATASTSAKIVSDAAVIRFSLILFGAVIIVFASLFYVAQRDSSLRRLVVPVAAAALLISLGIFIQIPV